MSYTITPHNHLIRRVPEQPSHIERDEKGKLLLTSAVFKYIPVSTNDGVSVDVLEIRLALGTRDEALHEAAFKHFTKLGAGHVAAILLAAVPLQADLACMHDPVTSTEPQLVNPAHALIMGKIDKTLARKLAKACEVVERP